MRSLRSLLGSARGRPRAPLQPAAPPVAEIVPEVVPLSVGGIPIRVAVSSTATDPYSEWIRRGLWTEPAVHWALRITQHDWDVLDLGAHVGTFALTVAERCNRVVAVEAMPDNFVLLVAGVGLSEACVVPVHAAVARHSGTTAMSDRSAWARVDPAGDVVVPSLCVRDIYSAYGERGFDLVKVDIEGSEQDVLPALLEVMAEQPRAAMIYESNQAVSDTDVRSLHDLVARAGFEQWYLDPRTLHAVEVDPSQAQYTLNCDILALKGHPDVDVSTEVVTPNFLREHIAIELTTHPVSLHRSYAFCVAAYMQATLGADFVTAMHEHVPQHPGAGDEMERFRGLLRAEVGGRE